MKRKRVVLNIVVAVVAISVVVASIYLAVNPAGWPQVLERIALKQPEAAGLTASGFIEAEEVDVAPELGGRVLELAVEEGDDVEAGQVLVRLDGTLLEAQVEAAQAALDVAQAKLAQVRAGARPEQIRQAEAALAQAEAARDGAYQAWQDAAAIRDNPQELDAQIAQAEARAKAAEAALAQATWLKDAAEIAYENYWDAQDGLAKAKEKLKQIPPEQRPTLPGFQLGFHLIPNQYWKAWIGVNTAHAALEGAQAALRNLYAMRHNPQELEAQVDVAETQYRAAETHARQARAYLDALLTGATEEDVAVAEAHVEQTQAALDVLIVQRGKLTIVAPVGGVVLERSIREGELAVPGGTLLTLGDLDQVTLTVYVPENKLGQVGVGQRVEVRVDSFPERTFTGQVVAIANKAEFTPRNVQTQEDRVNMVFAVDMRIPNPDHALKPGLPADATIITEVQ